MNAIAIDLLLIALIAPPTAPPSVPATAAPAAGQSVVLRTAGGRFLGAADDGTLHCEAFLPGNAETFQLFPCGEDRVALRSAGGRFLVPSAPDGRSLRATGTAAQPGAVETLLLVPVGSGQAAFKVPSATQFVGFPAGPASAKRPAGGLPVEQTLEIYRVGQLPVFLQSAMAVALEGLLADQLGRKGYDKTTTHKIEKSITLPDPTLKDLKRTKQQRVLSTSEESRVEARLDAAPRIRIGPMPLLTNYRQGESHRLLFMLSAALPVEGHVHYRVPEVLSATTGYRTTVEVAAIGEVSLRKSGDRLALDSPQLCQLLVTLRELKLSNDLLKAVHHPIQELLNHELEVNHQRIQQQANEALATAINAKEFHHPLLQLFALP
jgi:hypothetical protein